MNKKWLVLACAMLASTVVAVAQTFVGHRGSIWGVENATSLLLLNYYDGTTAQIQIEPTLKMTFDDSNIFIRGEVVDITIPIIDIENFKFQTKEESGISIIDTQTVNVVTDGKILKVFNLPKDSHIYVYNILGQIVESSICDFYAQIDMSNYPNGTYVININDKI